MDAFGHDSTVLTWRQCAITVKAIISDDTGGTCRKASSDKEGAAGHADEIDRMLIEPGPQYLCQLSGCIVQLPDYIFQLPGYIFQLSVESIPGVAFLRSPHIASSLFEAP